MFPDKDNLFKENRLVSILDLKKKFNEAYNDPFALRVGGREEREKLIDKYFGSFGSQISREDFIAGLRKVRDEAAKLQGEEREKVDAFRRALEGTFDVRHY